MVDEAVRNAEWGKEEGGSGSGGTNYNAQSGKIR
jgi:hypothetical protein